MVEILVNPDGRLVLDRVGEGRSDTGVRLDPEARERVIRLIADYVGDPVTRDDPRLSGVLPGTGERFQGFLPPATAGPASSIRKRPAILWRLEDYVRDGVMTQDQAALLRAAVTDMTASGAEVQSRSTVNRRGEEAERQWSGQAQFRPSLGNVRTYAALVPHPKRGDLHERAARR